MAWTTPKTNWDTGELVAASDMNAIGENLAALDTVRETVAAYTTTADISDPLRNSFGDVDSNFNLTLTTAGGDVLMHFEARVYVGDRRFDVEVDGSRIGHSDNGIWRSHSDDRYVCFTRLIQGLGAGSHTFKLQSKGPNDRTLYAGAQFWVREI